MMRRCITKANDAGWAAHSCKPSRQTAMDEIRENPMASPRVQGVVRSKRVQRFPYSVMYSAENGNLRILAIANQKRRPLYWFRRQ